MDTDPPVLVSTAPADNSSGFPINNPLVMTFDETVATGSGDITIRHLGGGSDTSISINADRDQVYLYDLPERNYGRIHGPGGFARAAGEPDGEIADKEDI